MIQNIIKLFSVDLNSPLIKYRSHKKPSFKDKKILYGLIVNNFTSALLGVYFWQPQKRKETSKEVAH